MARNRYGWQKRAKELARKQKSDDKMKRRQGKTARLSGKNMPGGPGDGLEGPANTQSAGENLPANPFLPD